jgi:hypothetical protein
MGSIVNLFYAKNGRVHAAYVYLIMGIVGDTICAKIGITNDPFSRLKRLRAGLPFVPEVMGYFPVPSRERAKLIEAVLLRAVQKWAARGEWMLLEMTDKAEFNTAIRTELAKFSTMEWPLKWQIVDAAQLEVYGRQYRAMWMRRMARRGKAFSDFSRHSRK